MTRPSQRRPHRYGRAAVAALVLAWGVLLVGAAALADPSVRSASADTAPASKTSPVLLLQQTPWVEGHGSFGLTVRVAAKDPSSDKVQVSVFNRLVTRSDFQNAAQGRVPPSPFYSQSAALASLKRVDGGVRVALPVDAAAPTGSAFSELPIGETGVFPVQVSVVTASGAVEGSPITTFLVYASGSARAAGYKPLSVAAVVPYSSDVNVSAAGTVEQPSPSESQRLNGVATALSQDAAVHATVLASPLTVSTLATSSAALDKATAVTLRQIPNAGLVQVLPATYSPASLGPLVAAGLGTEVDHQIAAGAQALTSGFGTAPSSGVWVDDGDINAASLAALVGHGVRQLVLPESDLAPLPEYDTQTTFASPTSMKSGDASVTVIAADEGISDDFVRNEPPVLAANVLLAELAMIQTEEPGISDRGVVAVPPSAWVPSPRFVGTLIGGLDGNPLLSATTVSGLFQAVGQPSVARGLARQTATGPAASTGGNGGAGPGAQSVPTAAGPQTGQTVAPGSPLSGLATTIVKARSELNALDVLFPARRSENAVYGRHLLVAESALIDQQTRVKLLDSVESAVDKVKGQIRLPGATSITLTSTKGSLPLTILNAAPGEPRVQLVLTSQRLIFRSYRPPGGKCTVPTPTTEVCRIRLTHVNTTLNIPVETRSSGVFPLEVSLYSVGGGLLLANNQDTVRSTVVSQVAVALMVLAVLSVAIWWFRDLRKGRRPATLAPSPDEDKEDDDVGGDVDGDSAGGSTAPGNAALRVDPPVSAPQVSPLDRSRGPS